MAGIRRDYYAGGLISLLGSAAALVGLTYPIGTLSHMGPGLFPVVIGALLIVVGLMIAATAAMTDAGPPEPFFAKPPQWKAWGCILAGPILFIVTGKYFGLAPAIFLCVFIAAIGDRQATLKNAATLAGCITLFGVCVFGVLLQIPFPLVRIP